VQALFDELIEISLGLNPGRAERCSRLLECLTLKIQGMHLPEAGLEIPAFQTYRYCREHIGRHFQRLRTLAQIAEECNVDGAYLCRLFRRHDRQSPYHSLLRLKVNLAAELLQRPASLIKQVAEQAGFAAPFHFSRRFKNLLGVSPAALRRMQATSEMADPNPGEEPNHGLHGGNQQPVRGGRKHRRRQPKPGNHPASNRGQCLFRDDGVGNVRELGDRL
jgi:AraC-like DNA-binding protein